MNHSEYHTEWQTARINFLTNKYGVDFFKDKRILELAGFNGRIGAHFAKLGAIVDCVEGREENVKYMKETYPELNATVADLDTDAWPWGKYDIIINFGLFYHLENHHRAHLLNCINNCDLMFFETVIYDSPDAELYFAGEKGIDQSLTNNAGTPSTPFVENIFKEASVSYVMHKDPALNGGYHTYNWKDTFTKKYHVATRRLWIVGE